jgi:hypothetical protein
MLTEQPKFKYKVSIQVPAYIQIEEIDFTPPMNYLVDNTLKEMYNKNVGRCLQA